VRGRLAGELIGQLHGAVGERVGAVGA